MSTGIALPFHDLGTWVEVGGQHHAPNIQIVLKSNTHSTLHTDSVDTYKHNKKNRPGPGIKCNSRVNMFYPVHTVIRWNTSMSDFISLLTIVNM